MRELTEDLRRAQMGDGDARERVIRRSRCFVHRVVSGLCRRELSWDSDDELSIGLIALNEAIDRFDPERGASFHSFVRLVVQSRLADYWRRERSGEVISLDEQLPDREWETHPLAAREAMRRYRDIERASDSQLEMEAFERYLEDFDMTLEDLTRASPRHAGRRARLTEAAEVLARDRQMMEHLLRRRQLPLVELSRRANVNRKTLSRGRRYIIALALIAAVPQFEHLRSFAGIPHIPLEEEEGTQ
ncbi:MAG: RNA polymerase sigma factor SigI [Bacillota bacterium]